MSTMSSETTTNSYEFQAEINQLMSLIINSFYSNREIFLREIVSNSSDAIDKHRHNMLSNGVTPGDYSIKLIPDKTNKILYICDNGIGMTKDDLINNLGTIAKSGTKAFMEKLNETQENANLIGQFGVGFYSAYLVSNLVQVYSVKDTEAHVWESNANGNFSIKSWENIKEFDFFDHDHGSIIALNMKDDQHEFLEEQKIKGLIKKHNQFITYPIEIYVTKTVTEEIEDTEDAEDIEKNETKDSGEDETEVKIEEVEESEEKSKKMKKVEKTIQEFEQINKDKPIWTKNTDDVSEDEYKSFYKSITGDWDDYVAKKHFSVEGQLEFKSLLYIPKRAPYDLFEKGSKKQNNIKLYVKKVFVTDESEHLMPEWLNFVKGIVDSEDLPLNISREFLQQNKVLKTIQKNLIKKSLEMISDLEPTQYTEFYKEFSKCLKLGAYHESTHRNKIMELLRYNHSKSDSMMSLKEYVDSFVENQDTIYYMCGENVNGMKKSPFIERFNKLGINVLFMNDPIDEYMMQQIREYENGDKKYKFVSVNKEGLKLPGETTPEDTDDIKNLCTKMKELLDNKVEKVVTSNRIVDAPTCIVTAEYGWSANMERIMKAQALRSDTMGGIMSSKKILEINPQHEIIKNLNTKLKDENQFDKASKDVIQLLYEVSLISSGFQFDDPSEFTKRMYRVISLGTTDDDEVDIKVTDKNEFIDETETESEVQMESVD